MRKMKKKLSMLLAALLICCMVVPAINVSATEETEEPTLTVGTNSVNFTDDSSAMYLFEPTETGYYKFYSEALYDVWVRIYDSNMDSIADDDDGGDAQNFRTIVELTGGEEYYVEIGSYDGYDQGAFDVIVEEHKFTDTVAANLSAGTVSVTVGAGGYVWHTFTPTADGTYRFYSTSADADIDPNMEIYMQGNWEDALTCEYDSSLGWDFDFEFPMIAGKTYYLKTLVSGGDSCDLTIEYVGAFPIITEATQNIEAVVNTYVWYTFTLDENAEVRMYTEGNYMHEMDIYEDIYGYSIEEGTSYGENLDFSFTAVADKTYYVRVYIEGQWGPEGELLAETDDFDITVEVEPYGELTSGTTQITQEAFTEYYYTYTPEEDGWYIIYSESECDPAVTLYEFPNMDNSIDGADDSEIGDNTLDFQLKMKLSAGKTYGFKLYIYGDYDEDDQPIIGTESFELTLKKLTQDATSVSFVEGETIERILGLWDAEQLEYEFAPADCIPEDVTFTSSDEDILSFNEYGYMILHGYGTATVTITTENGLTDTMVVNVIPRPTLTLGTVTKTPTERYCHFYYQYTPQVTGLYKLTMSSQTEGDSAIYADLYDCEADEWFAYEEDYSEEAGNLSFTMSLDLEAGKTYYFDIGTWNLIEDVNITLTAQRNGWVKIDGGWYYYQNGQRVKNSWRKDSKGWCYLGSDGRMATNKWVKDSKGWCYVGADGYCVTNCWKKDSKGWCYLGSDGRMVTNKWVRDSKGWCYIGSNGYAVTNCWKKDSKGWCYLDSNGSMTKSKWVKDGGKWYYLDSNGYMVTGRKKIGSKYYTFNSSGVWVQ